MERSMKTVFLISIENQNLAKTIVSLEENSTKADKYILLVNSKTCDKNKNIVKSLSGACCGQETKTYQDEGYEVSIKDNFVVVQNNSVKLVDLMNYAKSSLIDNDDIIFTATSGTVFDKLYVEKILDKFKDQSVGLVYSDYLENGNPVYLQYVQPMLQSPIKVKELAVRKSLLSEILFNDNSFNFMMDLFNVSIIRHIPEEIYAA